MLYTSPHQATNRNDRGIWEIAAAIAVLLLYCVLHYVTYGIGDDNVSAVHFNSEHSPKKYKNKHINNTGFICAFLHFT